MVVVGWKDPMQKPETFTEAIELVWMIQLIGNLFGGSALSLARFDQYMYLFSISMTSKLHDHGRPRVC